MNLAIVENKLSLNTFVNTLRAIALESGANLNEYYMKFGINWKLTRSTYVFAQFSLQVVAAYSVNIDELYNRYNLRFKKLVLISETGISDLVTHLTEEINPAIDFITCWREVAVQANIRKMYCIVEDCKQEINEVEDTMESEANKVFKYWLPLMKECCNDDPTKTLQGTFG